MYNTFEEWANMPPMKYCDIKGELTSSQIQKKEDMLNNKNNDYIASVKNDGEWGMFIKWDNQILIRTREISKTTGKYGDVTLKLPHLITEMEEWPNNSVVLGEIVCKNNSTSNTVGSILRCLVDKALERQIDNPLYVKIFDILAWSNINLMETGYEYRVNDFIKNNFTKEFFTNNLFFKPTDFIEKDFIDNFNTIVDNGGEGIVIQRKDALYYPGKRPLWQTLKVKQSIDEMELLVIDTLQPVIFYTGKDKLNWLYWVTYDPNNMEVSRSDKGFITNDNPNYYSIPVTKVYFYNWKAGVIVQFGDKQVKISSGVDDNNCEWLATPQANLNIKNKELYAIVGGMQVTDDGSIRHPIIKGFRIMDDQMKE